MPHFTPGDCNGHSPLAHMSTKGGMDVTARWATGLNDLNITDIRVTPPAEEGPAKRWNVSVSGVFTNLHVWAKVLNGGRPMIDDNLCCDSEFRFVIQASAVCVDGQGFSKADLNVLSMNIPDLSQKLSHWENEDGSGELDIVYGQNDRVKQVVTDFFTLKMGRLMTKTSDGKTKDAMQFVMTKVEDIVQLNTGHRCPGVGADTIDSLGPHHW